ncbi:MAG: hypothetical protein M3Q19_11140 [Pseudomonadota bacterium]|nr:hypothetical protein [Pseudomonadota bacterium]
MGKAKDRRDSDAAAELLQGEQGLAPAGSSGDDRVARTSSGDDRRSRTSSGDDR